MSRPRLFTLLGPHVVLLTAIGSLTVPHGFAYAQQAIPAPSTKTEQPPEAVQILTPHEGVDFTPYGNHLVESINRNWYAQMPQEAKSGLKGKVVVRNPRNISQCTGERPPIICRNIERPPQTRIRTILLEAF
jgi:hypothetical protein